LSEPTFSASPKYDADFKKEAVELSLEPGKTAKQVAEDLGVPLGTFTRWRCEYAKDRDNAFPGHGNQRPNDNEVDRLRRELLDVKMERDILKKAVAIFSKNPNPYSDS